LFLLVGPLRLVERPERRTVRDFPICPDPNDPDACNVYNELQFPDEVYPAIQECREERA